MNRYLLIESLDPFESNDVGRHWEMAVDLARRGNRVTLFLVQNGVLAAREGARNDVLHSVAAAGVEVLADEFSLRERGIDRLMARVKPAPLDVVLDRLAEGCKALWH
jgi:sulfur transfer complex TusBCD TusB component (DsrH family)